jgi:pimeloyl-ACP methyl ester carboxylesterase
MNGAKEGATGAGGPAVGGAGDAGPVESTRGGTPLRPLQAPGWARAMFRAMSAVLPKSVAARLARKLYFTPVRARVRDTERAVLARATRSVVGEGVETAFAYAWGEGPAVLLVHGWGGHAGQMMYFVEPLVRAGFRAISIDLPGHGQSPRVQTSAVHFARTVELVAARNGPIRAVIAHSLGASAVTYALSRGLEIERAVFFAAPGRFDVFATRFQNAFGASDELIRSMLIESDRWLGVELEAIRPTTLASALRTPLLIFHDEADGEIPVDEGVNLARAWPGATLERTSGLGHLRSLRDPKLVNQAVRFVTGEEAPLAAAGA